MKRALLCLMLAASLAAAEPTPVPPSAPVVQTVEDPWRRLLLDRVSERGGVAFDRFNADDRSRLERVLAALAAQDISRLDRDHAIAFWLNAYHAMVMAAVVRGESPTTMTGRARMYHWFHRSLGGYKLTLDDVRFILNGFASKDPRIHLAIYDGTRSGPGLLREPYNGDTIDHQLVEATRRFVNDSRHYRVNAAANRIALSKVFEWYRADFERESGTLARFLAPYAQDAALVAALSSPVVGFESLPYDWQLDGRGPAE